MPLVAEGLSGDTAALCNSVAYMTSRRWNIVRQLHCDTRNKHASVTDVTAASRKEEAGCETLVRVVAMRDRSRNCRLACAC